MQRYLTPLNTAGGSRSVPTKVPKRHKARRPVYDHALDGIRSTISEGFQIEHPDGVPSDASGQDLVKEGPFEKALYEERWRLLHVQDIHRETPAETRHQVTSYLAEYGQNQVANIGLRGGSEDFREMNRPEKPEQKERRQEDLDDRLCPSIPQVQPDKHRRSSS